MDNAKINTAAQEILAACLAADDPVACLHAELDRLRTNGGSSEVELKRLELLLLDSAKHIVKDRINRKLRLGMRPTRGETEISAAIQACAKLCMNHSDPRGCAEAYAASLIATGWAASDTEEVQAGALGVLRTLTGDESLWPE